MNHCKAWLIGGLCFVLVAIAVGCGGRQASQLQTFQPIATQNLDQSSETLNITLIQHESCFWSYFWCVVENGINDAAQQLGVNVTIKPARKYDIEAVAKILGKELDRLKTIDPAKHAREAIGVAVIDAQKLSQPLEKIINDYDIPVIAYNAEQGKEITQIPYLSYIGQDDERAGYEAGLRLAQQPYSLGVCIMHQVGAPNLRARCDGFRQAMRDTGKDTIRDLESQPNAATLEDSIRQFLVENPDVNVFLTVGPKGAAAFYRAIASVNRLPDQYVHGSFDLSSSTLEQIKQKKTLFTVDQQPYLEGYLTVQWLTWIRKYHLTPPDKIISTGPHFVDIDSVEQVEPLVGRYR